MSIRVKRTSVNETRITKATINLCKGVKEDGEEEQKETGKKDETHH